MMELTKENIQGLLATNDRAVERAILCIYDRQTRDEKAAEHTTHLNTVGFTAFDAKRGSYWARLLLSGHHLYPATMDRARRTMMKYWRQLIDEAEKKAAAKASA